MCARQRGEGHTEDELDGLDVFAEGAADEGVDGLDLVCGGEGALEDAPVCELYADPGLWRVRAGESEK